MANQTMTDFKIVKLQQTTKTSKFYYDDDMVHMMMKNWYIGYII